jgi:Mu-like prophage I protein
MPYDSDAEVPDYVPQHFKPAWRNVWNHVYESAMNGGKSASEAEGEAFKQANGVIKAKKMSDPRALEDQGKLSEEEKVEGAEGKDTASVGGAQVHRSDFLIVPDPDKPSTWKLPVHDCSHVQNAMACFNQTQMPAGISKDSVARKLASKARGCNIKVDEFKKHLGDSYQLMAEAFTACEKEAMSDIPEVIVPHEIPIAVTGTWTRGDRRFSITAKDLDRMVENFEKRKNGRVVVDYEHASETPEVARGGPVPAAGWITKLRRANGKLMALVDWTADAADLIRKGAYKFFSPAINWGVTDKRTGRQQGATLTSGALVNKPFLEELPAINLSEFPRWRWNILEPDLQKALLSDFQGIDIDQAHVPGDNARVSVGYVQSQAEIAKAKKEKLMAGAHTPAMLNVKRIPDGENKGKMGIFDDETLIGVMGDAAMQEMFQQLKADEKAALKAAEKPPEKEDDDEDEDGKLAAKEPVFDENEERKLILSLVDTKGGVKFSEAAELANQGKIRPGSIFRMQEATKEVEGAVRGGKILPKMRAYYMKQALSDLNDFKALVPQLPVIVDTKAVGHGNDKAPENAYEELEAEVKAYMSEQREVGNKDVSYAVALSEVTKRNPDLWRRHTAQVVKTQEASTIY